MLLFDSKLWEKQNRGHVISTCSFRAISFSAEGNRVKLGVESRTAAAARALAEAAA
jgi:hypothetical protein